METPFEAFMADLHLAGRLVQTEAPGAGSERLPERLNAGAPLDVTDLRFVAVQPGDPTETGQLSTATVDPDELLLVVPPAEAPAGYVHAAHHPVVLELGPYRVSGDLATLPGFDPGRALARPSGQFITLKDVRVEAPTADGPFVRRYAVVLVNRYTVERVWSDIDLSFFFPGARHEGRPEA